MQRVISNSSPIIHLAKIAQLDLLKEYFGIITVPESVYDECVAEGKDRPEALLIKNSKWIEVMQAQDEKLIKLLKSRRRKTDCCQQGIIIEVWFSP